MPFEMIILREGIFRKGKKVFFFFVRMQWIGGSYADIFLVERGAKKKVLIIQFP